MALSGSLKYFPYQCKKGGAPKEKESEVIERKDPLTKKVKVVPEVLTPITHGRTPLHVHQLLEDDWRAFKSATKFLCQKATFQGHQRPRQQASFPVYDSRLPSLGGLLYSHHNACRLSQAARTSRPRLKRPVPLAVFSGPFQSVVNIPDCGKTNRLLQRERDSFYPSSSLVLRTYETDTADDMTIYNEPNVIPMGCLAHCFDDNIVIRSMKKSKTLLPYINEMYAAYHGHHHK